MINTVALPVFVTTMITIIVMTKSDTVNLNINDCPEQCQCTGDLHVSCINGALTEVPLDLKVNIRYLNISGNSITTLANNSLLHLPKLWHLNLAGNNLSTIARTAFIVQAQLSSLDLHNNMLDEDAITAINELKSLVYLDLHSNMINSLPENSLLLSKIQHLDLSQNNLSNIPKELVMTMPTLNHLNLSYNHISEKFPFNAEITNVSIPPIYELKMLDLSHNYLTMEMTFVRESKHHHKTNSHVKPQPLKSLKTLYLAYNPYITNLGKYAFEKCPYLEQLDVSHMDNLKHIDMLAFSGLTKLQHLDLSHNTLLSYLHALTFKKLTAISDINLGNSSLSSIYNATFQNLTSLTQVRLGGNPWACDCDSHWIGRELTLNNNTSSLSADDFICSSPPELIGLRLIDILPTHNFSCHRAYVVNHTRTIAHTLGSSAVLNCVADGDPKPSLTWITPRKDVIHYYPAFVHPGRPGPQSDTYHIGHSWHGAPEVYAASLPPKTSRMQILHNGSLYIDYVQRHDAGRYTCLVYNRLGNDSVVVHFHLNYLVLTQTMVQSIIIGFLAAAIFLALGLITAMIRYLVFTCSHEQRQKRKSVREILDGLETYRSVKMDRLSAYKQAKIGQLAAFKTAKVDKLRGYKNITVTTIVHYLQRSREHYANQTVHIKENCAQQVDKLRDSYSIQKLKFKDYRSHQVDKIKDNYNGQLLKIRLYGAGQLEKLQSQYKLQQQHILKLLELLDIGNCMSALEAECLRTDSTIFNSDLSFDLEAAVYLPHTELDTPSLNGSEYMTAGDTTDQSSEHSNSGSVIFDVKLDGDPLPTTTSLSNKTKAESISSSTLTQLKVDLAAAGLLMDSNLVKDNKESRLPKGNISAVSSGIIDTLITTETSAQSAKSRHSRRKHRHKTKLLDEDNDDDPREKRPRQRRISPKDRHNKREHQPVQVNIGLLQLGDLKETWVRHRDILSHAAELDKTLEDIAIDIDNLKEPLKLTMPDIDLSLGINSDTMDDLTPTTPVTTVTIENEARLDHNPICVNSYNNITPHHQGSELREKWHKESDPSSIEAASTDYESAQEPESRGNTPQVGFYEHAGSPQSFASFPSTPSTPTFTDFPHVIMLAPRALENSSTSSERESTA